MARKAAMQMSLGFIVAIVFAVVFLSLAVVWVTQFMQSITPLTDDLIQDARVQIRDTFSRTDTKFSVYPQEWELDRNRVLKMLAGLINKEADSTTHRFVVNVITTPNEYDVDTESWINRGEFSVQQPVPFNSVGEFPITITPGSARTGTYTFYVIACMTDADDYSGRCEEMEDQNYDSPKYFRITLK
jgi:hypothetical protein